MRPQPQEIKIKKYIHDIYPKLRYEGPYKKAVDVAEYYGFHLLPTLKVSREDRECTNGTECAADRVTLLREYLEKGMDGWAQPVQLCHTCKLPYQQELNFKLEAVGSKNSIAEAILIHTAYIILKEYGHSDITVAINSVGGVESLGNLSKELSLYFKKHINDMDEDTRHKFMQDTFAPLRSNDEFCIKLRADAPKPISFLTEQSRRHFSEVLEYLESFGIPYNIKDDLVGSEHYNARTIFEIYTNNKKSEDNLTSRTILGRGERYDLLAKKVRLGRKIPAVGISIDLQKKYSGEVISKYRQKPFSHPIAYFVHVGPDARRGSLQVIERLRLARIPVAISFAEERLENQMKHAESLDVDALIIVGQKEITEGTAIIRNQKTHVQKIVPQSQLPSHLKRLCSLY